MTPHRTLALRCPPSRRLLRQLAAFVLCLCAGVGLYLWAAISSGNFHAVVAGELYRSAQLAPEALERLQERHGFQTIVNLRGGGSAHPWYTHETGLAAARGIRHVDFDMRAHRFLTESEAKRLLHILQTSPKPILIHCKSGADRTGLAAALYLAGVKGSPKAEAQAQLSLRYGHFSLPFLSEYNMDRSFKALAGHFGYDRRDDFAWGLLW